MKLAAQESNVKWKINKLAEDSEKWEMKIMLTQQFYILQLQ